MILRRRKTLTSKPTVVEHLAELRYRILYSALALTVGVAVGFYLASELLALLLSIPEELVYLHPGEAFFAHLKIALLLGLMLSAPVILFQVLAFTFPGLKPPERRAVLIWLPFGIVSFAGGIVFAYAVVLPIAYRFFMGFASESLQPLISVSSYLSFVLGIVLPFGLLFQMPLMAVVLTSIGLLNPAFLARNRKIMLLLVFVAAAFLTPPDFVSQALLAGPLILLYEFSLILSRLIVWRRQRRVKP